MIREFQHESDVAEDWNFHTFVFVNWFLGRLFLTMHGSSRRSEDSIEHYDFRVHAALLDHTVLGALSPPHTSRALGWTTQRQAQD